MTMLRIAAAFLAVTGSAAAGQPAESGPVMLTAHAASPGAEDYTIREFEKTMDAAFATGDFVGLSIAIIKGGETRFVKSWGVTEKGGAPVTPKTVFRVGSLSKGFAATLAALAIRDGLLSEDDPATRFAPALKFAGGAEASLTLGNLLSQSTGLPPNAYDNLLEDGVPIAAIYPKYRNVKLICPVGRCYSYQNITYDIAGLAVSSAYGEPYREAAREKLFAPLGLADASIGEEGLEGSREWARPHVRERRKGGGADDYGPWREVEVKPNYYRIPAAGGVNASVLDMALWLKAQMGGRPDILPHETLELIHAPKIVSPAETLRMRSVSPRFGDARYAYGWRVYDYEGRRLIAHAGTVEGYAAQLAFLPDTGDGIVILSNSRSKRLWRILPTFLDLELGLPREDYLALNTGGAVNAGAQ